MEGVGQVSIQTRRILEAVLEMVETSPVALVCSEKYCHPGILCGVCTLIANPLKVKINGLLLLFPQMFSFYLFIPFQIGNDCKSLLATESAVF